jgi:hypothetical protein
MDRQTLAQLIANTNPKGVFDRQGREIDLGHARTNRTERILRHYSAQRRVTSPSLILAMALSDLQGRNAREAGAE